MEILKQHQHQERAFLQELEEELAMTQSVVKHLTDELTEAKGCLEEDPEADRFFQHLLGSLEKMQQLIHRRQLHLPDLNADSLLQVEPRSRPEYQPQSLG